MDNNNPAPQPIEPQIPGPNIPITGISEQKSSSKVIRFFIIGIVIVAVLVGGIYLFLSSQQKKSPENPSPVIQSPTTPPQESLESDLNNINVDAGGEDSDFTAVDQDLQQL